MKKALIVFGIVIVGIVAIYGVSRYVSPENNPLNASKREALLYVYETDADSADECSSYETYDRENNVCYFECSDDNECNEIQNSIMTELDTWSDQEYDASEKPVEEDDLEKSITETYTVLPNEVLQNTSRKTTDEGLAIWKHIKEISPDSLSNQFIEEYVVFNDPQSDTLAFVDDIDGNGKWRIAVNQSGYDTSSVKERNLTIVHELSHIVTLNNTQLIQEENCVTYKTDEGCATTNSYLYAFVKKFWSQSDIQKSLDQKSPAFSPSYFVTEYATTNPEEDIAESFAYFVVDADLKNQPSTIKNQKISFFNQYPEIVSIRQTMRQGLISDIIRARKAQSN